MTNSIIWFNPDTSEYETGEVNDFRKVKNSSINAERFELIGSVPGGKTRIAQKVIESLNLIRQSPVSYN